MAPGGCKICSAKLLIFFNPTEGSSFWHSVQINFKKFVNKSVMYDVAG